MNFGNTDDSKVEESKLHSTDDEEGSQHLPADTTFEFDPHISPENRFIQFKASNIGRVLNLGADEDDEEEESEDELDEGDQ